MPFDYFSSNMQEFSNSTKALIKSILEGYNKEVDSMTKQKDITDAIINAYDQQSKLFMDFNKKFSDSLKGWSYSPKEDGQNKEFEKNIENQFESSRKSVQVLLDFYEKSMTGLLESKKDVISKIDSQIDNLTKNSLHIWSDLSDVTYNAVNENRKSYNETPAEETLKKKNSQNSRNN